MLKLPPVPTNSPPGSSFWNDWYEKLRTMINSGALAVLWTSLNFTGSKLTDIVTRLHNSLQGMQGGVAGEYYHITAAEHTALGGAVSSLSVLSKVGAPTTADIAAGKWAMYKDTSSGTISVWTNDGGVMKQTPLGTAGPITW